MEKNPAGKTCLSPGSVRIHEEGKKANCAVKMGRASLTAAVGISLYLAWMALAQSGPAGCGDGSACSSVLGSKWAGIFGLPIGVAGGLVYLLMLLSSAFPQAGRARLFVLLLITGGALWFTGIQAFILKSFCPWCCTAHALAVCGALLIYFGMRAPASAPHSGPLLPAAGAVAVLAGMAALQIYAPALKGPVASGTTVATAYQAARAGREFVEVHGKFRIMVDECDSLGDAAKAEFVAVGLFDYSCGHCRKTLKLLSPIVSSYGGRLAVLKLPGYFDDNGREIHRMLLSVLKADPALHAEVSGKLYTEVLPAQAPLVKAHLESRMGKEALARMLARNGPGADKFLGETKEIAGINKSITRSGRLPQLIAGSHVEAGSNDSPAHYRKLFADTFGLSPDTLPQLVCDPPVLDFGRVIAMGEKTADFTLTNRGQRLITLGPMKRPKGLIISGAPEKLAPGESQRLTARLQVPQVPSGRSNTFFLIRSDASEPEIKVPAVAAVWNPFRTDPVTMDFGDVAPGAASPLRILTFQVEAPVKLGEVSISLPDFTLQGVEEAPGGKEFRFSLISLPTGDKGYRSGYLNIPLEPLVTTAADGTWPRQWRVPLRVRVLAPAAPSVGMPADAPSVK